jgi:hypothetical protein
MSKMDYIKYIFKNYNKGFLITYMYNINQNKFLTCCGLLCLFVLVSHGL